MTRYSYEAKPKAEVVAAEIGVTSDKITVTTEPDGTTHIDVASLSSAKKTKLDELQAKEDRAQFTPDPS
jgi:hypothetical protein